MEANMENPIYSYSWDDAIEDGTFIRVEDKLRQEAGIKYPTAVTSNLFHKYIQPNEEADVNGRLWDLLWMMRFGKIEGDMSVFKILFGNKKVDVWAKCEARSPSNPEPILTFMLPEDY
jgi:hypothetical protein